MTYISPTPPKQTDWLYYFPIITSMMAVTTAILSSEYGFSFAEAYPYYAFTHPDAVIIGIISQWLSTLLAAPIPGGAVTYRILPIILIVTTNIIYALGASRCINKIYTPISPWFVVGFVIAGSLNPLAGSTISLTSNYYHYTWAGSSLTLGAILMASCARGYRRQAWLVLGGGGLMMVFFGRAPGAIAVGLFASAIMASLNRDGWQQWLIGTTTLTTASLLITAIALITAGEPKVLLDSIAMAITHSENTGPTFLLNIQLFGTINFVIHGLQGMYGPFMAAILLAAWGLGTRYKQISAWVLMIALFICISAPFINVIIRDIPPPPQQILTICLGASIILIRGIPRKSPGYRLILALAAIGLLLPLISQTGSAASIIYLFRDQMGPAALLLLLAARELPNQIDTAAPRHIITILLILSATLPTLLTIYERGAYVTASLSRQNESFPLIIRPQSVAGLRTSTTEAANLVALHDIMDRHGITPDSHALIGYYETSGAAVASGLTAFGHVSLSDYYQRLACAYLDLGQRQPGQRLLIMETRTPDPILAQCLARSDIGFPTRYRKLGTIPWLSGTLTLYEEFIGEASP